ncbi:hypothetical protein QUF63_09930 [Anaerolineales bacterium HSG25]|nr:hypothetical protein [Anaerolineales bacterium HSG25]
MSYRNFFPHLIISFILIGGFIGYLWSSFGDESSTKYRIQVIRQGATWWTPVPLAKVTVTDNKDYPIINTSANNLGFAYFNVSHRYDDQEGTLIVEAEGYNRQELPIPLDDDGAKLVVELEPIDGQAQTAIAMQVSQATQTAVAMQASQATETAIAMQVFTATPTDTSASGDFIPITPTSTPEPPPTKTNTPEPTDTPTLISTDTPTFTPTNTPTLISTDTPTFTPTNTPTFTPTNTPSPTFIPTPTDIPAPTGSITLTFPQNGAVIPESRNSLVMQWKYDGGCTPLPEGYGFEVRGGKGNDLRGVMDARNQQEINCFENTYSYTLGDRSVSLMKGTGRFYWAVAVVQIEPYTVTFTSEPHVLDVGGSGSGGDGSGGVPCVGPQC